MISSADAVAMIQMTRDEDRLLAKLEAAVDSALAGGKFTGGTMTLEFKQVVEPKIAFALARKYESQGNWRAVPQLVPAFDGNEDRLANPALFKFSLTPVFFTPPVKMSAPTAKLEKVLPPVLSVAPSLPGVKRLLVRMPTRGRPAQALAALAQYRALAGLPITIEVVIDEDDETMLDPRVLQRLRALECVITVGSHISKVEAVNDGRVAEWDVLLLASDDMMPVAENYGVRVLAEMDKHWPHLDGAIFFDDGMQKNNLCTLPIIGRNFYDRFEYVYHSSYKSLFCDTEQTELWTAMGRLTYVDECVIEHRHHVWGKAENDALYQRNDQLWAHDQKIYEARKTTRHHEMSQFTFDTPPLFLSICIVTMSSRRQQLNWLVDELYRQIKSYDCAVQVEILIDSDEGTIGEKRQRLIEKSKALFVCFIDDDDLCAHDYVERLLSEIHNEPDADCCSLNGVMTTAGGVPEKFEHSIKHQEWTFTDGVHKRGPNHLNVIRRDLALKVGFPSVSHSEDYAFSTGLRPLLKKEINMGDEPLYSYLYWPAKAS